jgi:hypothetical protein
VNFQPQKTISFIDFLLPFIALSKIIANRFLGAAAHNQAQKSTARAHSPLARAAQIN